jgi:hypothetical protein
VVSLALVERKIFLSYYRQITLKKGGREKDVFEENKMLHGFPDTGIRIRTGVLR